MVIPICSIQINLALTNINVMMILVRSDCYYVFPSIPVNISNAGKTRLVVVVLIARVPVILIDKVHVGLPVEMIFSAFNQRTTPRIPGVVTVVSADRTTDERTGEIYYKIQARVTEKGLKLLQDHQIRPGMPVEVFVITGERTMMNYLLRPFIDRVRTSLGEE